GKRRRLPFSRSVGHRRHSPFSGSPGHGCRSSRFPKAFCVRASGFSAVFYFVIPGLESLISEPPSVSATLSVLRFPFSSSAFLQTPQEANLPRMINVVKRHAINVAQKLVAARRAQDFRHCRAQGAVFPFQ